MDQLEEAVAEAERLRAAIRRHRDYRGDEKCWRDNADLYASLPEGHTPPPTDVFVELENCIRYIRSCHDPNTKYVSPQIRIEELEVENKDLRAFKKKVMEAISGESK